MNAVGLTNQGAVILTENVADAIALVDRIYPLLRAQKDTEAALQTREQLRACGLSEQGLLQASGPLLTRLLEFIALLRTNGVDLTGINVAQLGTVLALSADESPSVSRSVSAVAGHDATPGALVAANASTSQTPRVPPAAEPDLAAIRDLLLAAFAPDELRRFCLDRKILEPIVSQFAPSQTHAEMVDRVIDYCRSQLLFPELLAEIEKVNKRQYARFFGPCGGSASGAATPPG